MVSRKSNRYGPSDVQQDYGFLNASEQRRKQRRQQAIEEARQGKKNAIGHLLPGIALEPGIQVDACVIHKNAEEVGTLSTLVTGLAGEEGGNVSLCVLGTVPPSTAATIDTRNIQSRMEEALKKVADIQPSLTNLALGSSYPGMFMSISSAEALETLPGNSVIDTSPLSQSTLPNMVASFQHHSVPSFQE